jgi:hypothetical protein
MSWFLENRRDLARHVAYMDAQEPAPGTSRPGAGLGLRLLAVPSRERLARVLARVLDEREFLSPWGVRSLSRAHRDAPYVLDLPGAEYRVEYAPGESTTSLFGGNSNWRGPVWFPLNYLLIEALERYDHFYRDTFTVECPTGSGVRMTLGQVAREIEKRLASLFLAGPDGRRPCQGDDTRHATDPSWRDLVPFHEYFDGDTGRGCGASHQTGWTALVVPCLEDVIRQRSAAAPLPVRAAP